MVRCISLGIVVHVAPYSLIPMLNTHLWIPTSNHDMVLCFSRMLSCDYTLPGDLRPPGTPCERVSQRHDGYTQGLHFIKVKTDEITKTASSSEDITGCLRTLQIQNTYETSCKLCIELTASFHKLHFSFSHPGCMVAMTLLQVR